MVRSVNQAAGDTGILIFARMDSSRLPGKSLLNLGGKPLLKLVLDRARMISGDHQIVIATSDRNIDNPIAGFAEQEQVNLYRGSLADVASRALSCCEQFGFKRFVRICGDRPFLPWELVDELILANAGQELDLLTNALEKTYPGGTMTEIVTVEALRRVIDASDDEQDREHLTRFIYANPELFRIANLSAKDGSWRDCNLSVDTELDMLRTEWMLTQLGDNPEREALSDVVSLAQQWNMEKERSRKE